ncbi:MAG: glycosyltransferase family 2 protein [bacterium]
MKFAIIVPAHNESHHVRIAIDSLKECVPPSGSFDIVVIADNCTDNTASISEDAGCRVLKRTNEELRGKGYALEFAFNQLIDEDYDAFIVVDADTRCQSNLLVEFEKKITQGENVLQAPYLVDGSKNSVYSRIVSIGFRAFNYLRPSGRELLGFSAGIFGTGFALTKKAVTAVPYTASSIVEDLEYHISLVRAGFICRFVPETCVYSEMPEGIKNSETQRSRWEGGRLRMIAERSWPLFKEVLQGRWRLIEPLLELLMLPLWMHVTMISFIVLSSSTYLNIYSYIGIVVVFVHIVAAILSTGGGLKELKVLFLVPKYILWKIVISNSILRKAGKNAGWERTGRD